MSKKNKSQFSVFIIDDHPVVREGLMCAIRKNPRLQVIGEAETALEAMDNLGRISPDIILVDLSLPDGSGFDVIEFVRREHPEMKILVVSSQDDLSCVKRAVGLGADGYMLKTEPTSSVVEAIIVVLHGKPYLSPKLASLAMEILFHHEKHDPDSPEEILSKRELEIFEMIGQGKRTSDIAQALHLSERTVETHNHNIRRKVGSKTLIEFHHAAFRWVLTKRGHI